MYTFAYAEDHIHEMKRSKFISSLNSCVESNYQKRGAKREEPPA